MFLSCGVLSYLYNPRDCMQSTECPPFIRCMQSTYDTNVEDAQISPIESITDPRAAR